ncbi:MAG: hypothetical protein ACE5DS_09535, partial [Kiloniellaceae bacterium]
MAAVLVPGPVRAAGSDGERLQALIQDIKSQLDRAERDRLIDPWFLRDLRQTLGTYEWPWRTRLLSDDFSSRGPQPEPPWQVTAGEVMIDWRFGLRSVVEHPAPAPAQPAANEGSARKSTGGQAASQIFGRILQQALQGPERQSDNQAAAPPPPAPAQPAFAAAMAPVVISNAFAMRLEMTVRPLAGPGPRRFEFGPYQGADGKAGYRLAYNPGAGQGAGGAPTLELLALSSRGASALIEAFDGPLALDDGAPHVIQWTRDSAGRMEASIDETR